jgi:hypothetical protein
MKFGQYLKETAVPAWLSQYINYKKLKKVIKKFPTAEKSGDAVGEQTSPPDGDQRNGSLADQHDNLVESRRSSNVGVIYEDSPASFGAPNGLGDLELKVRVDPASRDGSLSAVSRSPDQVIEAKSLLVHQDSHSRRTQGSDNNIFDYRMAQESHWASPRLQNDISPELLDKFHKTEQTLHPNLLASIQLIEVPVTEQKMIVHVPRAFPHAAEPMIRVSHKTSQERVSPDTYNQVELKSLVPGVTLNKFKYFLT